MISSRDFHAHAPSSEYKARGYAACIFCAKGWSNPAPQTHMKLDFRLRDYTDLETFAGWRLWQKPKPTHSYAIGVDVAEGIGGDASCMAVLDIDTGLHMASFWSNTIDVENMASEIYKAGKYFNNANICIESNNHGHAVIALLGGAVGGLQYPHLYKRFVFDEYTQKRTKKIGFSTNSRDAKTRLIENLKSALKNGDIISLDRSTIQELGSFCRDERTGRMAAKGSAHDDRVMALAFAWEQTKFLKDSIQITSRSDYGEQKFDPITGFPLA